MKFSMAVIFGLIALISFIVASPIAQNDPALHNIEGKTHFKNFICKLLIIDFCLKTDFLTSKVGCPASDYYACIRGCPSIPPEAMHMCYVRCARQCL